MHTAHQLRESFFDISVGGSRCGLEGLFGGWGPHDRFGAVVVAPYGLLGASLLTQAAITAFYDFRRQHRDRFDERLVPQEERDAIDAAGREARADGVDPVDLAARGSVSYPVYPEIYLFHVGARHGDHSPMDVWPPNREVLVAGDLDTIVRAINDRAITRLAVPDGPRVAATLDWEVRGTTRDLVDVAFAYAADGTARDSDVWIRGRDKALEDNPRDTLDMPAVIARWEPVRSDPSVARFLRAANARLDEVPDGIRVEIAARRERRLSNGLGYEGFRRIELPEALELLAGHVASASTTTGSRL